MEVFSGETEENPEDVSGRKKSKLKSLKTRIFGKSKRAGGEESSKLSQSASDITAAKGLGSEEDLTCPQGTMGSRALSHDSIFLADQSQADPEPVRVLSQENVHSKIKALQMKLQQQKMHLGPPPMVLPIRRPEDVGGHSEDSLPHSPPDAREGETPSQGALIKAISQSASRPLSPTPKPGPTKSLSPTPSHSIPVSVPSVAPSSSVEAPLDFTAPATFTPCLDTSAARHRMSVKPRHQRASTKRKLPVDAAESDPRNNSDRIESVEEEEQQPGPQEEMTIETKQEEDNLPIVAQSLPSKSAEIAPKPSFSNLDPVLPGTVAPVASQVLRVKPHRRMDATSGERPHSSYIESELKEKREADFEIQVMSQEKRNTLNKVAVTDASSKESPSSIGSTVVLRSSSVRQQQAQTEDQGAKGIRRPTQGSGSFHISITSAKNRDAERPRSGSFVEVLEQARLKATKETEEKSMREKEDPKGLQPRGSPFTVGRLRQEAAPLKSAVPPLEKRDSLKRVASKNVPAVLEGEEVKNSQVAVEEAEEAKEVPEEEGKTPFGVKLRSTSQSIKLRSDSSPHHQSKSVTPEDQSDTQKRQDACKTAINVDEKLPANLSSPFISKDLRPKDPAPTGLSPTVKHVAPLTDSPPVTSAEVQVNPSTPKEAESTPKPPEPQPAPQPASAEVSWMSLAMEKTRSLHQLFTSRLPRDLTGTQPAARPQAQPTSQAEAATGTQTQTAKVAQSLTQMQAANQPSAEAVKAEVAQSRSQTQTVKPAPVQQKNSVASPVLANPPREPQISKQTTKLQSNATQPASHPPVQTNQTETTTQSTQGSTAQSSAQSYLSSGQQQPSWTNRGLHPINQPKSSATAPIPASTVSSAVVPPSVSTLGRADKEATGQKEGPSLSTRRAIWTGSVGDRAALLEKRTEWTAPPGPNGVEQRKAQTEVQISAEPPAKATPVSKDTAPEGRQGVKLAESSPTKVPERPREERWPRKTVVKSSSPSSSPTIPSVLQSMSDSGQPSWMELAKRKSMAWSDKTMD